MNEWKAVVVDKYGYPNTIRVSGGNDQFEAMEIAARLLGISLDDVQWYQSYAYRIAGDK
jgi:hypothetical protein